MKMKVKYYIDAVLVLTFLVFLRENICEEKYGEVTIFPEGMIPVEQTTVPSDAIIVVPQETAGEEVNVEEDIDASQVFGNVTGIHENSTFPFPVHTLIEVLDANSTNDEPSVYRASCECGRPSSRIVGGDVADISQYPWTASLVRVGGYRPYCGGTLIADRIILTASHCVDGMTPGSINVVLNRQNVSPFSSSQKHSVSSIAMHPYYNRRTVDNDIAILRISPPVAISRTNPVIPACVIGSRNIDFTGSLATVVGFGATSQGGPTSNVLRKVTIPVISSFDCNRSKYAGRITDNMICAGDIRYGGKDSCQGDSGGPLIVENGGRRTLIGIVSWGYGCAQPNSPGVYTKVQNYGDWILANSQGSLWCQA